MKDEAKRSPVPAADRPAVRTLEAGRYRVQELDDGLVRVRIEHVQENGQIQYIDHTGPLAAVLLNVGIDVARDAAPDGAEKFNLAELDAAIRNVNRAPRDADATALVPEERTR